MDDFDFLATAARDAETDYRRAVLESERETGEDARRMHDELDSTAVRTRDELVSFVTEMERLSLRIAASHAGVVARADINEIVLSGAVSGRAYTPRQAVAIMGDPALVTGLVQTRIATAMRYMNGAFLRERRIQIRDQLPTIAEPGVKRGAPRSLRIRDTADLVLARRESAAWQRMVADLVAERAAEREPDAYAA